MVIKLNKNFIIEFRNYMRLVRSLFHNAGQVGNLFIHGCGGFRGFDRKEYKLDLGL